MATRTLPIGLLAAALGGACGSGSSAKPDGGGRDHIVSSSLLVGIIDPGAPPPCITAPLLLVGGQAQCTIVQQVAGTGGVTSTTLPSCFAASQGPCWSLIASPASCPGGGLTFSFDPDPANPNPTSVTYDYSCQLSG